MVFILFQYLQQKCYDQYGYQEAGGFKKMEIQVHWLAHHPPCHYTKWYLKKQDDKVLVSKKNRSFVSRS